MKPKIALVDNAIYPEIYRPVEHWSRYLQGAEWIAFRGPIGDLPRPEEFSHIILTGSEASILDRAAWVDREADFIREAFREGRPLLGSCYGHQLLALALAGPEHVGRCREPEIGWIPIEIKTESKLLGPKGTAFTFSVHFDEVKDLEEPFIVLASTDICPIQAFEMKTHPVWGLQIHPEIDVQAARALLRDFGSVFPNVVPIYQKALASKPRDSGLIFKIVNEFLRFSP
jgi:GMP synthase-like glutamine amidotransferase